MAGSFQNIIRAMKQAEITLSECVKDETEFAMPFSNVQAVIGGVAVMIASDRLPGVKSMLIEARKELHKLAKEAAKSNGEYG